MSRLVACGLALVLLTAPARAGEPDPAPELLLSPTTQLYLRWDGIAPHKDAYRASIWGSVMDGPTGASINALLAKGPKFLGSKLLAEPLLDGKPPEELRAVHVDVKNAGKLIDLFSETGIMLAAEVREPLPSIEGISKTIGGLLDGAKPDPISTLVPEAKVLLIVPDVGDRAEQLFSGLRLLTRNAGSEKIEKLPLDLDRTGFRIVPEKNVPVHVGWWVEGKHFVFYAGTVPINQVIRGIKANVAKGGLTKHKLLLQCQKCSRSSGFESVARGFVDTASVVGVARRLAAPFVPGLSQRIDGIGLSNLQAVVFTSGFAGKESRAVYEFVMSGERQGLAKILKSQPLSLNDLPPLPPDVSRFSSLRVDFSAAYDAGLSAIEAATAGGGLNYGVEDKAKNPADAIRLRKEYLMKEVDKQSGISVKDDLLPYLGDKLVVFQTPSEGLSVFGSVIAISCKDPAKVKSAVDRLRGLEAFGGNGPIKIRKKMFSGVEMREIYSRGFGVVTPSYAVVGEWLVIAGHPQPIQGLILRSKGELERWTPDAATSSRLAKLPADAVGIQYCHPKSTTQNLCVLGPLFITLFSRIGPQNNETDFDPIDIGMLPNGHELSKHLFPNLTVTRDDGRTIRIEVNESFSIPFEVIGFEIFTFGLLTAAVN